MLRFKTKEDSGWISLAHPIFDATEVGSFPIQERRKAKFCINPLTPRVLKELDKSAKLPGASLTARGNIEDFLSEEGQVRDKRNRLLLKHILVDWHGILDEEGVPLECSLENALKLFDGGYSKLGAAVIDAARELMSRYDDMTREYKETSEKNSGTSQSG